MAFPPGTNYPNSMPPANLAYPPVELPDPKQARRGPVRLIIIAAIVMALGFATLIVGGVVGVRGAGDFQELEQQYESGVTYTIDAEPNTAYGVYSPHLSKNEIQCLPEAVGGGMVTAKTGIGTSSVNDLQQILTITTGEGVDAFTLVCTTPDGSAYRLGATVWSALQNMVIVMAAGGVIIIAGVGMLVGGLIWLVVRMVGFRRKLVAAQPQPVFLVYPQAGPGHYPPAGPGTYPGGYPSHGQAYPVPPVQPSTGAPSETDRDDSK